MLKRNIELVRDGERQALLTWHKDDGQGGTIPVAAEFYGSIDEETQQHIIDVYKRPMNIRKKGKSHRVQPGTSKHFLELPKVLSRLGFRTRLF